jgi:hypothetical protein
MPRRFSNNWRRRCGRPQKNLSMSGQPFYGIRLRIGKKLTS